MYMRAVIGNMFKEKEKTPEEKSQEAYEKDPAKAIRRVMGGTGDPESLGKIMGIPEPEPQGYYKGEGDDLIPLIAKADQDYGDVVKRSLMKDYAPGKTQEQVTRDVMGFAEPKAEKAEPSGEFWADLDAVIKDSGEDSKKFVQSLNMLSRKYVTDPEALKKITELINLNKKASTKTTITTFEDYGNTP